MLDFWHCWLCVVDIRTGRVVYSGKSEVKAAIALNPGTTYGTGITPEAAQRLAEARRKEHAQ